MGNSNMTPERSERRDLGPLQKIAVQVSLLRLPAVIFGHAKVV
jgi:hypothetical protein